MAIERIKYPKEFIPGSRTYIHPVGSFNHDPKGEFIHADYIGQESFEGGDPVGLPVYTITNIAITVANKVGDIYWVPENTPFVITGDITDTDNSGVIPIDGTPSQLIVMAERLIDDVSAGDDVRIIADIVATSGNLELTLNMYFKDTGNFWISIDRLNRGLERINKGYRIAMVPDGIEFDVHIPVVV